MSGIALALNQKGYTVSGSDNGSNAVLDKLAALNITVYREHKADNIKNADLIVYTGAVSRENPELVQAAANGTTIVKRAELLGLLMKEYETPIAVSGMHGKTTVTTMISNMLLDANRDPTIFVGGNMQRIGGNYYIGTGNEFVFESDEYQDSFLNFFPKIAVVLNIEEDHPDYFKSIDHILDSFSRFINLCPSDGLVISCADNENAMGVLNNYNGRKITYALYAKADITAQNITYNTSGFPEFDIVSDKLNLHIALSVPGIHNVSNALAAFAVACELGIDNDSIKKGFLSFNNSDRRFQYIGKCGEASVFDDYAHHPTEIKSTFDAMSNMNCKNKICIFQPHTYTRTAALFESFVTELIKFDKVIITDIYAAREADIYNISGKDLSDKIPHSEYISDFNEIAAYIKSYAKSEDIIVAMGAGDIYKVSELLINI